MFSSIRRHLSVAWTREAFPISFQSILPLHFSSVDVPLCKCSSACSNMVSSSPRFSVSGVIQMQNLCLNPWTSPAGSRLVRWRQFPALWVGYQQKEDLSGWRVPWADLWKRMDIEHECYHNKGRSAFEERVMRASSQHPPNLTLVFLLSSWGSGYFHNKGCWYMTGDL